MILYSNFNAVCGQKIELLLLNQGLDYQIRSVNLRAGEQMSDWFLALNPKGQVPVLEDRGEILVESNFILAYLDKNYLNQRLSLQPDIDQRLIEQWFKLIDHTIHDACSILSWAIAIRPAMLQKTAAELEQHFQNIPDKARRDRQRKAFTLGLELPEFGNAIASYQTLIESIDRQLKQTQWLAGDQISIADYCVIPYIVRLIHLDLSPWFEQFSPVSQWLLRLQATSGFKKVFFDAYPSGFIETWQSLGKQAWPKIFSH